MYLMMTLKSSGKELFTALPDYQSAWLASLIVQRDAECKISEEPPTVRPMGDYVPSEFITLGNLKEVKCTTS